MIDTTPVPSFWGGCRRSDRGSESFIYTYTISFHESCTISSHLPLKMLTGPGCFAERVVGGMTKRGTCASLRLGTNAAIRFCQSAMLATEEDIAPSFEELYMDDLFFFFGFFAGFDTFIRTFSPSHPAPLALSATYLPVKTR
jgi:hypothetical protein